jgi:hypothetical protein
VELVWVCLLLLMISYNCMKKNWFWPKNKSNLSHLKKTLFFLFQWNYLSLFILFLFCWWNSLSCMKNWFWPKNKSNSKFKAKKWFQ